MTLDRTFIRPRYPMTAIEHGKTPIRIRGKRTACKAEKWHFGKKRKHLQVVTSSLALSEASSQDASGVSRAPKRRKVHLARLEQLPVELIQEILLYSGNLDLPLASPRLASQLSGKQMQWQLTKQALSPMIHCTSTASSQELRRAERLLSCRFMTWTFFAQWLDDQAGPQLDVQPGSFASTDRHQIDQWRSLRPSADLVIPVKLLHGPWTRDKISFLRVLASNSSDNTAGLTGLASEIGHTGLIDAAREQCMEALELLRRLGIAPDQELLRNAIVDFGCQRDTVMYILRWCASEVMRCVAGGGDGGGAKDTRANVDIDFLDPVIWAWAEKARKAGDAKGEWLTKTLKRVSSVTASGDDTQEAMELSSSSSSSPRVHTCN
ncbi:hypothetical protein LTR95_010604 [Oleoguttula sp. CCFEE 5521]